MDPDLNGKLKYVNVSNPIQVRCNLCDYYTNSIHKLQLHATNPRHETSARIFLHLQLSETILRSSQREERGQNKNYYYNCSLCSFAARTKVNLVHHVNSIKHSTHELTKQQMKAASGQGQHKSLEEEIRETFQVKELLPGDQINFGDNGKFSLFFLCLFLFSLKEFLSFFLKTFCLQFSPSSIFLFNFAPN